MWACIWLENMEGQGRCLTQIQSHTSRYSLQFSLHFSWLSFPISRTESATLLSTYNLMAVTIVIPKRAIILLAGIPASGKGEFAKYLERTYGFAHYDLENYPHGWNHPKLKAIWDAGRAQFLAELFKVHERIVLDWGFPPHCLPWIEELQSLGVQLIWFDADLVRARQEFVKRQRGGVGDFDKQVTGIQKAGFPSTLRNCVIIPALSADKGFLDFRDIASVVFQRRQ